MEYTVISSTDTKTLETVPFATQQEAMDYAIIAKRSFDKVGMSNVHVSIVPGTRLDKSDSETGV